MNTMRILNKWFRYRRYIFIIISLILISRYRAEAIVSIQYIGHATTLITSDTSAILTDPFFADRILGGLKRRIQSACKPEELPPIDIVLISHTHPDHYDMEALKKIKNKPIIIVPWKRSKKFIKMGFQTIELQKWETYNFDKVVITAVPAKHLIGHCLGYIIQIEDITIYFTGDTKRINNIKKIKNYAVDVMLVPYGGFPLFGSIWTSKYAAKMIGQINPRIYIPIHWGTFKRWWTWKEPISPEDFSDRVREYAPHIKGVILQVGEIIEVSPSEKH